MRGRYGRVMTAIAWSRSRVRRLAAPAAAVALAAGAWLYLGVPGVGDAPQRVRSELRAHGGTPLPCPPPARVASAVIAVEDARYWHHGAVDPVAIGRALVETAVHPGSPAEFAKVLYLDGSTGALATARAIGLAFKLEHRHTKPQIPSRYLDGVYFGHGHWGIGAASQGYFGVSARRLSWAEASLVAGLPQAPTADDPLSHFSAGRVRRPRRTLMPRSSGSASSPATKS